MSATLTRRRVRARIEGTVQGVGFRPFVHRLAAELALSGWVHNDTLGVVIEAEGESAAVQALLERLSADAPPLARVEGVTSEDLSPTGERGFAILKSPSAGEPRAAIAPDSATCEDCLAELFDPADRRFRYPFVNCTNCGPRFTIVRGVPYDRPLTTMAGFAMCPECRAEYDDPADRRFHAQPIACPACGPRVRLHGWADAFVTAGDPVRAAADALASGLIVAVKGIGGYHLACRADDEGAVARLRARKHREDKPFALMAPTLDAARDLAELTALEEELLTSVVRPIVLVRRREAARVASAVAPFSRDLGVMLPYSPLHHLLLADSAVLLVMTSANVSDEPIAYTDEDALERLAGIADGFLLHDRPIHTRTDDSVVGTVVVAGRRRPLLFRRSRGHVPASLDLPVPAERHVLACGAEIKNTFCVAKGTRAWVGHHVGDLRNYETLRSFTEGVAHLERLLAVEPELVAHDLHPDYLSTRYAVEREGLRLVGVQHHHAHLAACLAEYGAQGPAVGAIYDGTGYGIDETVWGGEILVGDLRGFERVGHLHAVRMPGGEAAVRAPWRMACAWLDGPAAVPIALEGHIPPEAWRQIADLGRSGLASPLTTSAGRLFDAAAALCGIRHEVIYEGQAAIEFEAACDPGENGAYEMPGLDARVALRSLLDDLVRGTSVARAGARFHNAVADATAGACAQAASSHGTETVVLSGGVFQNRLLLERTARRVAAAGLRVLVPEQLPPGDGGIAFGQAAVAAARSAGGPR